MWHNWNLDINKGGSTENVRSQCFNSKMMKENKGQIAKFKGKTLGDEQMR